MVCLDVQVQGGVVGIDGASGPPELQGRVIAGSLHAHPLVGAGAAVTGRAGSGQMVRDAVCLCGVAAESVEVAYGPRGGDSGVRGDPVSGPGYGR